MARTRPSSIRIGQHTELLLTPEMEAWIEEYQKSLRPWWKRLLAWCWKKITFR